MDTPIVDFVEAYWRSGRSRLHMPGHKGRRFLGCEALDITEFTGADVLHDARGIIAESEKNAAALFGAAATFYSAEGSSLSIKAMLFAALQRSDPGVGRPVILAARNVHKTFIHACALLDLDVEWLYPENALHLCRSDVSAEMLARTLHSVKTRPFAVYVTSPDYLGNILDIAGLAAVCHEFGLPLLVDSAHGAYLRFLPESWHPLDLGAAMCCDSAHKTLPVLTGGAYLHVSGTAQADYAPLIRSAMALFASTSPSYLILQSLDLCNRYLSDGYPEKLIGCIGHVSALKATLTASGWHIAETEPLKLVIDAAAGGMTGNEVSALLTAHQVECEFADPFTAVLMFTPENRRRDFDRIAQALSGAAKLGRTALPPFPQLSPAERKLTIRRAVFSRHETVPVRLAAGRVCAAPTVSCPPAVPIAVSGEVITEDAIRLFELCGIDRVEVISG